MWYAGQLGGCLGGSLEGSLEREHRSLNLSICRLGGWSDGVDVYIVVAGGVAGVVVSLINVGCYEVVDGVVEGFEDDRVEPVFCANLCEFEGLFFAEVGFEVADHGVWAVVAAAHFLNDGVGDGFWGAVVEIV